MAYDITVIGAAIIDVLASPVRESVFSAGSVPAETIRMSFGGDALNETVILSRLGKKVQLISKVGDDEAGKRVLGFLQEKRISIDHISVEQDLDTGINIVLIDEKGERHFVTNPHSSLRKLDLTDIQPFMEDTAEIISFASMFVSPLMTIPKMKVLFSDIKAQDKILAVDMTKAKNGETIEDIAELLPCIDYIFPNEAEISLLTGESDPKRNAELLLGMGVKTVVIKCGEKGCILGDKDGIRLIPAVPAARCVDTTGAGDTFVSGFLWALSEGWEAAECAKFACAAASFAVETVGATGGIPSLEDIRKRYEEKNR
ncbi:MAG: carbohydrate kinase family protein [Anaerotignum sp.]|nr:carbohydrate kinase family protein [Anaerotignum sp.]